MFQCVQNQLARVQTKSPSVTFSVPFISWQIKGELCQNCVLPAQQLVYLYSMVATSLPSHSPSSNKAVTLSVLGSKPTQTQEILLLCLIPLDQSINQSINQLSMEPISPKKPGSVARQPNQCSTAKPRKQFCNINRPSGMPVSMWERPSQRYVPSDVS